MAKTVKQNFRSTEEFDQEIYRIKALYEAKLGVEVKKTAIVELAVKEGLNVLEERLEDKCRGERCEKNIDVID